MTLYVIAPAGGADMHLWPLSRHSAPKFLADLTGFGRSMLQATVDRLMSTTDDVTIVTGAAHADVVAALMPDASLVVEPSARGTTGAIGLITAIIETRGSEAVVGSFAADHFIADEEAFGRATLRAAEVTEQNYVVTIGVSPDRPSAAYGYIGAGESFGPARSVARFAEKPDETTVAECLAMGRYLWSVGMFAAKADVLVGALARFYPELAELLRAPATTWETGRENGIVKYWESLESTIIDTTVIEPLTEEGGVAVIPVEMGWSDVGDYASFANVVESNEQMAPRGPGQTVLAPLGALVYTGHKPVVAAEAPEAVVVDMDDMLFVTTRASSQDVELTVETLSRSRLGRLA